VAICRQLLAVVIVMSFSLCRGARSPRSHYDVILIVTSFATELATPTVTDIRADVRTCGHLTAFSRLCKEDALVSGECCDLRDVVVCWYTEDQLWRLMTLTSPTRRKFIDFPILKPWLHVQFIACNYCMQFIACNKLHM